VGAGLVTGEAVALDLRPAALPSRIVAQQAAGVVLLVLVLIVYPVTFETLLRGRTPGKAAMGLRVVRDDGGPIGFRHALARGLLGAAVERPGVTLFTAAVVVSSLNERHKRLGDLLAGTMVVRERVPVRGGAVAEMPPQLAGWAAGLDLTRLDDGLALSVRQFVARADQLTDAAREDLGGRLVQAVTAAVGPPPAGTPGWAVLSAVLAERRRRESERLAGTTAARPAAPPQDRSAAPDPAPPVDQPPPASGPGGFVAPG
jgi:uncharacterized RDD family membrane protein YckC